MEAVSNIPEEIRHDFRGICWWCGTQSADSREHKFKKSDLRQVFGRGAWTGDEAVVRGGTLVSPLQTDVQGPNSLGVKFDPVLCSTCNNDRSQPFDRAYSTFTAYLDEHEDQILLNEGFRFSDIYGEDWPVQRSLLVRYLIKHIGCRFAELGIRLPSALVRYLNSGSAADAPHLRLYMEVRLDIVSMMLHARHDGMSATGLWLGNIGYLRSRRSVTEASSFLGYAWLRINYQVGGRTRKGATNFEGDFVGLPADYNVEPTQFRAECSACNEVEPTSEVGQVL